MRKPIYITLAIVVLLVLGGVAFLATHERVPETVPVRPLPLAYSERFKVAERILQSQDIAARNIQGLQQRPPIASDAVAVIPAGRGAVSDAAAAHIIAAAESGAHIIVESEWIDNLDPLLDALNITREPIETDDDEPEQDAELDADEAFFPADFTWFDWTEKTQDDYLDSPMLLDVPWSDDEDFKISMRGGESLWGDEDAEHFWLGSEGDVRVFSYELGEGRITAINDISFATNFVIGRNDNAEVFWRLVNFNGTPSEVLFIVPREPGLMRWLAKHAWRALIALGVLVLIWLLAIAPRFGPVRRDPEPVRRRLLDHLRAAGRLLWQGGARTLLVDAAQKAAQRQVERQFPNFAARDLQERARILTRHYGFSASQAALLLQPGLAADAGTFIQLTKLARVIHQRNARAGHDPLYTSSE